MTDFPNENVPAANGDIVKNSHRHNAPNSCIRQDAAMPIFTKIKAVRFCVRRDDRAMVERTITARQTARTLAALVHRGASGITALEMSGWAQRLAAYVHSLRHRHGLDIVTLRETHEGGWHARYVLQAPVENLDIVTV
jgi:hypothetical protein